MGSLAHIDNLARNQHGGILGYVRRPDGRLEGPLTLDVFVLDGRLTCPALERQRNTAHNAADLQFTGEVVELDGAIPRALACGDMLIGLND
jgi:hypothetical protein